MRGTLPKTLLDWSSWAWSPEADSPAQSRILLVGECPLEHTPAECTQRAAPRSASALKDSLRECEPFDSALVSDWDPGIDLPGLVEVVSRSVRPGGTVAFVAPILQHGWRRGWGAVLGFVRRRRPVSLPELCAALLIAHLVDLRVRDLSDGTDYRVVWATVPSGLEAFDPPGMVPGLRYIERT